MYFINPGQTFWARLFKTWVTLSGGWAYTANKSAIQRLWDRDTDFRFRFIELPRYLNTTKKKSKIGVEATVNSNLSFLVAEIFVFLNYSKIVLLRQENIRIMLAVLLL